MPRVFISSVVRGLAGLRKRIYDLVKDTLNWEVWCAEIDRPDLFQETPYRAKIACFEELEKSDIYLGIFATRYGSDPLGVAFTELEYHHAVSHRKPRKLYILQSVRAPEPRLCLFLGVCEDPAFAENIEICQNDASLLESIKVDLDTMRPGQPEHHRITTPPPYLERLLRETFETESADAFFESCRPVEPSTGLHLDWVQDNLAEMDRLRQRGLYASVLSVGARVLDHLRHLPPEIDTGYLPLWREFLRKWQKSVAWYGVHAGNPLASLPAAKALLQTYQMLEDYEAYYATGIALASCCYSLDKLEDALNWIDFAEQVLCLPKLDFRPRYEMWVAGMKGNILYKRQRYQEAASNLAICLALNERHSYDEASFAMDLSALALVELRLGVDKKEVETKLLDAKRLAEKGKSPGFLVRIKRRLAEHYADVDLLAAKSEIEQVLALCEKHSLLGQKAQARVLAAQLGIDVTEASASMNLEPPTWR